MAVSYQKEDNIEVVVLENVQMEYTFHTKTETEKDRLIKRIEKEVRASMEYADYINFLKQNIGMDACAFFNSINKRSNRKIRIEVHHAPLTLYDIVKIVLEKRLAAGEEINDLLIAEEVCRIHYNNQVGLIPLCKTLHEVIHNSNKLTIPMYMIYGDYKNFLKEYGKYYDWEKDKGIKKKIELMIERTKELNESSFDVLKANFTYIKVDGFEMPVRLEDEKEVQNEVDVREKKSA